MAGFYPSPPRNGNSNSVVLLALKGNVVVDDVGGAARCGGTPLRRRLHRRRTAKRRIGGLIATLGAFAPAAAIEKRQFAAKALQHNFGRLALIAVAVGIFARLQLAFEIDLRALLAILLGDL